MAKHKKKSAQNKNRSQDAETIQKPKEVEQVEGAESMVDNEVIENKSKGDEKKIEIGEDEKGEIKDSKESEIKDSKKSEIKVNKEDEIKENIENEIENKENETKKIKSKENSNDRNITDLNNNFNNALQKELESLKQQLQASREESLKYQTNYNNLLSRISSMKSVFHKMKEAQDQLSITQEKLNTLEAEHKITNEKYQQLLKDNGSSKEELRSLNETNNRLSEEVYKLQELIDDKENVSKRRINSLERQLEEKQLQVRALQEKAEEYLVVINEEKAVKHSLVGEVTNLRNLVDEKTSTIAELENNIRMVQSQKETATRAHEKELLSLKQAHGGALETLEQHEKQLEKLQTELETKQLEISKLQAEKKNLTKFEQEVKEKQLLIGKLRHEAIILNEHLTKALGIIKQNSESNTVDKELISNLMLKFVSLPRGDSKKFEVLSLIASYLSWTTEEKVQAGLMQGES